MSEAVRDFLVVTCEHGGNRIPAEYAGLFRGWRRILATHRGYDPGALVMARQLAAALDAPLVASTVSRLVVDLNRSLGNPRVWSDATRVLPPAGKQRIVRRHYAPYRQRVEALVSDAVAAGRRVIHLSSHSFTPVLDGRFAKCRRRPAVRPRAPFRNGDGCALEGGLRRACAGVARAPELSVQGTKRRPDVVAAPPLSIRQLCRHGDRAQPRSHGARAAVAAVARGRRDDPESRVALTARRRHAPPSNPLAAGSPD